MMDARSQSVDEFDRESSSSSSNSHLAPTSMERSASTNTLKFRNNYDALLKEVLEETSEDEDEDLLSNIDIDLNAATAELPEELRAALEDRALADRYLANLKSYMSHRRSHSLGSTASLKADYSSPNTPIQPTFSHQQPKPFFRVQPDPLSRILDAVPYHTRLVNGVQPLTVLEQKFHALRIPELDLPTVADGIIQSRLGDLYKIQDELNIHLHGGPLVKNTSMAYKIGEKKKHKVMNLLDDIGKEIGLYEEFVKRAHYLTLESILNESDSGDEYYPDDNETFATDSSLNHFESSSDISRATPGTPVSPAAFSPTPSAVTSKTPRRISSNPALSLASEHQAKLLNGAIIRSASEQDNRSGSRQSSEFGTFASDRSPSVSLLTEDVEPWEAFKWTSLKKISDQLYADEMRRHNGLVSVLAVSGVIAVGTTRSLIFVYDYSQNLKCILGDSARAVEVGSVTSLAISADHTTIACGHSQGYIVVWDINKPANPVRIIDPIPASQATKSVNAPQQQQQVLRKEGHVKGAAILHIGFVGVKKSEIVSGDDQGMAFYHVLYKVVMVNAVDTTRILGRYQNLSFPGLDTGNGEMPKPRRPSTVFAMQPLPLGQIAHPAENFGLVALLTPYKMIIVGLKPTPQTQYKYLKPKGVPAITTSSTADNNEHGDPTARQRQSQQHQEERDDQPSNKIPSENLAGCLAWLPVMKSDLTGEPTNLKDKNHKHVVPANDPMLAFSWGNHLLILRVSIENPDTSHTNSRGSRNTANKSKRGSKLEFIKHGEYKCRDVIVGLQWINRQILVLITPNEEMILFDPKNMVETERASIRNKQLVYHDRFNSPLGDLVVKSATPTQQVGLGISDMFMPYKTVEMAYYHSVRAYKGKLFLLGLNKLYIGALLSWADRIIALVRAGDFLEGIELATLFYNGRYTQTVVGLPEDEKARKHIVGEKLKELLDASLNYTFSSSRTYDGMADESANGGAVLFKDLAAGCVKACLSMNNLEYLFDTAYDRFAESDVRGVFLEVLEPYILQDKVSDIPPAVMKDLVQHYCSKRMLSQLEQVIWHVNPQCLDIDQIVSVCHREGLYEAMMYVWNRSMDDYVSPVVEMLKVIRNVIKDESTRLVVPQHTNYYQSGDRTRLTSVESTRTMDMVVEEPEDMTSAPRKNAEKLFEYFKLILTGRTFPDGLSMTTAKANEARSAVYSFVFSGRCVVWPRKGGTLVLTADDEDHMTEPTYPYLRLLLRFNTKKFLEALEIAFEDPWLNGGDDILTSTLEEDMQGKVISRQIIVNTLLDVMGGGHAGNGLPMPPPRPKQSISTSTVQSFSGRGSSPTNTAVDSEGESVVQLYMFIASNLHKYTTFILLPPTTLHNILVRLSEDQDPDTRQERQAAVQNLLTVFKPINPDLMVAYYEDAGFWQVLESVYQREKKYGKLVEANLKDDERRTMVFDTVYRLLDERSDLNEKRRNEVKSVFMIRISQFVEIDGQKSAEIVEAFFNGKHEEAIRRLEEDQEFDDEEHHDTADQRVFLYLRGLLEPSTTADDEKSIATSRVYAPPVIPNVSTSLHERYLELMCRFDPSGVYDYLNTKLVNDVNLDAVLKYCEEYEVIDAVVWIMEKSGNTQAALEKMLSVAKEKVDAILQMIRDHARADSVWTFEEQGIVSSCLIGLNGVLRVGTRLCENSSNSHSATDEHDDHVESLWFRLLDSYVESSIEVLNALAATTIPQGLQQHIVSSFKSFVQSILTHLLLSTSPQVSLPRLLSRLIESQARGENTFSDFRDIFRSMLDTYKYEGKLLEMTNRLFDRDLFKGVEDMVRGKGRGWRPRRGVCDICGDGVLDISLLDQPFAWNLEDEESQDDENSVKVDKDVVVFRCSHAYHRRCLESSRQAGVEGKWQCVVCHHGETIKEDKQQQRPQEEPKEEEQNERPEEEEETEDEEVQPPPPPPPPPKKEGKGKERATS